MHRLIAGAVVLTFTLLACGAAEPPTPAGKAFQTLQLELLKKLKEPQKPGERAELQKLYARKALDIAERNPNDRAALDMLGFVLRNGGNGILPADSPSRTALTIIERDHLADPQMDRIVRLLDISSPDEFARLVKTVQDKHPDKKMQGRACDKLCNYHTGLVRFGKKLRDDASFKSRIERVYSKSFVAKVIIEIDKNRLEAGVQDKLLKAKYADLIPDLIGRVAPEVKCENLDGQTVKLSALRGKVVVLDIWATWCGPCRAMIPHERELVQRLQYKSFALVSISVDDKKETVVNFLKREPMPWTHWWCGIVKDWEIHAYPTIYVLDAKGVIRHKFVGAHDKEVDKAVDTLLKEMGH